MIAPSLYILYLLGIASPKRIDREQNIKNRLTLAESKLKGALRELYKHNVEVDKNLKEKLSKTQATLKQISQKINGILERHRGYKEFKEAIKKW